MKTNIEKYTLIHNEVIRKLEDGEITIEMAKEVNNLAFDKYITTEKTITPLNALMFDKKSGASSRLGLEAYRLLCDIDKIKIENDKAKTANPSKASELDEDHVREQKKIWKKLNSLSEDEYNAGKQMYDARFGRNRPRHRTR